jgi:signal transduction histidine kinase
VLLSIARVAAAAGLLLAGVVVNAQEVQGEPDVPPRQVLVLQSMDRGSVVFDSLTGDFRAALQKRAGSGITLFDFVVAPAGLAEAPEKPVVAFLKAVYANRRPPDLIVTIGGPAAAFARNNRQQLFPQTPVVFAAVETRFLTTPPLGENEASVTVSIDYVASIEGILQLLPETQNVLMVIGSGPLSSFWQSELQRNFERFRNRLTFIWSQDLSYEQLLDRAETLPPHSAIYYLNAGTFATGSWQGDERTFGDLLRRANAPLFGAQGGYLGLGIVGGRLLDTSRLGEATADVVIRILSGDPPESFRLPPQSLGSAVFDARQLIRWNIPESRLPAGSDVQHRPSGLWEDHGGEVLTVLWVVGVQAALIAGLLYQRRGRRRAEVDSARSLSLAADVNRRMTMSALTGSIAHELSQPLNSILHNAQAGEMMIAANRATPEILREILIDIRTADVRATEIIERHRTMLRSHQLDKKPLDLHSVVRESVALMANTSKDRQIDVTLALPPAPCGVIGDRVLLQQVIVNLLMNAIDAVADQPTERRRIAIRSAVPVKGSVQISVRDSGPGLPASADGKLFEPFVTTKANGMGIGLTIARTVVEAHGGTIEAHNNPDVGAAFVVTLPTDLAAAEP